MSKYQKDIERRRLRRAAETEEQRDKRKEKERLRKQQLRALADDKPYTGSGPDIIPGETVGDRRRRFEREKARLKRKKSETNPTETSVISCVQQKVKETVQRKIVRQINKSIQTKAEQKLESEFKLYKLKWRRGKEKDLEQLDPSKADELCWKELFIYQLNLDFDEERRLLCKKALELEAGFVRGVTGSQNQTESDDQHFLQGEESENFKWNNVLDDEEDPLEERKIRQMPLQIKMEPEDCDPLMEAEFEFPFPDSPEEEGGDDGDADYIPGVEEHYETVTKIQSLQDKNRQRKLAALKEKLSAARDRWCSQNPELTELRQQVDEKRNSLQVEIAQEKRSLIDLVSAQLLKKKEEYGKETEEEREARIQAVFQEAETSLTKDKAPREKRKRPRKDPTAPKEKVGRKPRPRKVNADGTPSKAREYKELDPETKAMNALSNKIRTKMEKLEYELYNELVAVLNVEPVGPSSVLEKFESFLASDQNSKVIQYWALVKRITSPCPEMVYTFRELLYNILTCRLTNIVKKPLNNSGRVMDNYYQSIDIHNKLYGFADADGSNAAPPQVPQFTTVSSAQSVRDFQELKNFVGDHGEVVRARLYLRRFYSTSALRSMEERERNNLLALAFEKKNVVKKKYRANLETRERYAATRRRNRIMKKYGVDPGHGNYLVRRGKYFDGDDSRVVSLPQDTPIKPSKFISSPKRRKLNKSRPQALSRESSDDEDGRWIPNSSNVIPSHIHTHHQTPASTSLKQTPQQQQHHHPLLHPNSQNQAYQLEMFHDNRLSTIDPINLQLLHLVNHSMDLQQGEAAAAAAAYTNNVEEMRWNFNVTNANAAASSCRPTSSLLNPPPPTTSHHAYHNELYSNNWDPSGSYGHQEEVGMDCDDDDYVPEGDNSEDSSPPSSPQRYEGNRRSFPQTQTYQQNPQKGKRGRPIGWRKSGWYSTTGATHTIWNAKQFKSKYKRLDARRSTKSSPVLAAQLDFNLTQKFIEEANPHTDLLPKCSLCGKVFQFESNLMNHMKKMHPDAVPPPTHAQESENTEEGVVVVAAAATPNPKRKPPNVIVPENYLRCKICGSVLKDMFGVIEHIFQMHYKNSTLKLLQCPFGCEKTKNGIRNMLKVSGFDKKGLRAHLRKRHGKDTDGSWVMGLHSIRYIRSATKFHCVAECRQNFPTYEKLMDHYNSTHGSERYPCPFCGIYLREDDLWVDHVQLFHPNEHFEGPPQSVRIGSKDVPAFSCEKCKSEFSSKSFLQAHQAQGHKFFSEENVGEGELEQSEEDEEGDFTCRGCTKAFTSTKKLGTHQKACKSLKRVCHWCNKKFPSEKERDSHVEELHPEKPPLSKLETKDLIANDYVHERYKCEICPRSYTHLFGLRLHGIHSHRIYKYLQKLKETGLSLEVQEGSIEKAQNQLQSSSLKIPSLPLSLSGGDKTGKTFSQIPRDELLNMNPNMFKETFSCQICPYITKGNIFHILHVNFDAIMQRYCNQCDRIFSTNLILLQHNKAAHGLEPGHWEKSRPKPSGAKLRQGMLNLKCEICELYFTTQEFHRYHTYFEKGEGIRQCKHCDMKFMYHHTYKTHMVDAHQDFGRSKPGAVKTRRPRYPPPPTRGLSLEEVEKLGMPMTVQIGPDNELTVFNCKVCCKNFKTQDFLRHHIQDMHKEDAYTRVVCTKCNISFKRQDDLRKHESVTHADFARYECPVCEGTFRNLKWLKAHHTRKHVGKTLDENAVKIIRTNEEAAMKQLFVCKFCAGTFKSEYKLKNHVTTKHFSIHFTTFCDYCGLQLHPYYKKAHILSFHKEEYVVDNPNIVKEKGGEFNKLSIFEVIEAVQKVYDSMASIGIKNLELMNREEKTRTKQTKHDKRKLAAQRQRKSRASRAVQKKNKPTTRAIRAKNPPRNASKKTYCYSTSESESEPESESDSDSSKAVTESGSDEQNQDVAPLIKIEIDDEDCFSEDWEIPDCIIPDQCQDDQVIENEEQQCISDENYSTKPVSVKNKLEVESAPDEEDEEKKTRESSSAVIPTKQIRIILERCDS